MIALPQNVAPLPICRPSLMITGFLGAGKTTFLCALLVTLNRHHIAADVILNDYENAEVDAGTLRENAASVEALAASCACCDGLAPLADLAVTASRSVNDLLIIELNGTADPLPLLESFTLLESMLRFRPRWQVCILDARHFSHREHYDALEKLQLETASHFMLSHMENLSDLDHQLLLTRVRAVNSKASQTTVEAMAASLAQAIARDQCLLLVLPQKSSRQQLIGPDLDPVAILALARRGETSFLRENLPQLISTPRPSYVILNDFMNAEVDSALLREVFLDVHAISANCLCCDSTSSLIDELEKIPRPLNPIVFIEANGTTDPFPLIQLLTLDTALIERIGPAYQITVINESRWQKRLFGWDKKIEHTQAATASHLLTNRSEKASLKQQLRVNADLHALNPHAVRTTVADFISEILSISDDSTATLNPSAPIGHAHHQLALRIDLPPMCEDILGRWLRSFPPEVLRIKGLVRLIDDPTEDACFFQRSDDEWRNPSIIKTFIPNGAEPCAVFIGNGMDETKIRGSLGTLLYQSSPALTPAASGIPFIENFLANRCK